MSARNVTCSVRPGTIRGVARCALPPRSRGRFTRDAGPFSRHAAHFRGSRAGRSSARAPRTQLRGARAGTPSFASISRWRGVCFEEQVSPLGRGEFMKKQFKLGSAVAGFLGLVLFGVSSPDGIASARGRTAGVGSHGDVDAAHVAGSDSDGDAKALSGDVLANLGLKPSGAYPAASASMSCADGMVEVEGDYCSVRRAEMRPVARPGEQAALRRVRARQLHLRRRHRPQALLHRPLRVPQRRRRRSPP